MFSNRSRRSRLRCSRLGTCPSTRHKGNEFLAREFSAGALLEDVLAAGLVVKLRRCHVECEEHVGPGFVTGEHEALELRDADSKRYLGKGVSKAVRNVTEQILPTLRGKDAADQLSVDRAMLRAM